MAGSNAGKIEGSSGQPEAGQDGPEDGPAAAPSKTPNSNPLASEVEDLISDTVDKMDCSDVESLVIEASRGQVDDATLDEIANHYGFESQAFRARFAAVKGALIEQAFTEIVAAGADPQEVIRWARQNYDHGEIAEHQRRHYLTGDLSFYKRAALAYKAAHPRSTGES